MSGTTRTLGKGLGILAILQFVLAALEIVFAIISAGIGFTLGALALFVFALLTAVLAVGFLIWKKKQT